MDFVYLYKHYAGMEKNIAIIGAGLSGTLCAIYLLRKNIPGATIYLIEKENEQIGRGVAYTKDFNFQPLNVRAGQMSLYPDQPDHFLTWLNSKKEMYYELLPEFGALTFVPRRIFGDYLQEELQRNRLQQATPLIVLKQEVVDVEKQKNNWQISFSSQPVLQVDYLILASGNFPPPNISAIYPEINNHASYISYPWKAHIMDRADQKETILFIGIGLTTIDHLITLKRKNHTGKLITLSRNGYLPNVHQQPVSFSFANNELSEHESDPLQLFRYVRQTIQKNQNISWPNILDALRPHSNRIWALWNPEQKRAFLRHIRPFWEIHRHRIPESSQKILDEMISSGQLTVISGRIKGITAKNEDELIITYSEKKSGQLRAAKCDLLVNCTGPESNFRKMDSLLIKNLIGKGYIVANDLAMGIKTNSDCQLLNQSGKEDDSFFTLGPTRKGDLWETTALREIREQAAIITERIKKAAR